MCTCLDFKGINHYFGRTLDLDYHYQEEAVITPRGYEFSYLNGEKIKTKYAIIGTAMVFNDVPMYYEAANEKGLCIAGLNFPSSYYGPTVEGALNLTSSEIISYILSQYEAISDFRMLLESLNLCNTKVNGVTPPPLHFMISDEVESIVVEQTKAGLMVYENNVGVMTNNPPFNLQIKNLSKYEGLTNDYTEAIDLKYSCVGLGAVGLPGDFSSMSRFVKAAYLKRRARLNDSESRNVVEFFHILDSVSMVSGAVLSKTNKDELSYYTACINATKGIYYYKTYYDNRIKAVELNYENMNDTMLTRFSLSYDINIEALN